MKRILMAAVLAGMTTGVYAADFSDLQTFKVSDVKNITIPSYPGVEAVNKGVTDRQSPALETMTVTLSRGTRELAVVLSTIQRDPADCNGNCVAKAQRTLEEAVATWQSVGDQMAALTQQEQGQVKDPVSIPGGYVQVAKQLVDAINLYLNITLPKLGITPAQAPIIKIMRQQSMMITQYTLPPVMPHGSFNE